MSRTAQVKKDARIGEAEARRDATIRVSFIQSCNYRYASGGFSLLMPCTNFVIYVRNQKLLTAYMLL